MPMREICISGYAKQVEHSSAALVVHKSRLSTNAAIATNVNRGTVFLRAETCVLSRRNIFSFSPLTRRMGCGKLSAMNNQFQSNFYWWPGGCRSAWAARV